MRKKKKKSGLIWLFILILLGAASIWFYRHKQETMLAAQETFNPGGLEKVEDNYGEAINNAAKIFDLNPYYLKALCMLECSGRKYVKPRFEAHIYEKLKKVKNGELAKFENITPAILSDATDEALKNLASSWGPFQLMGYKCVLLNIKVADIRGEEAVYWGAKWINETYGNFVRKGQYKDAFHIHNAGKPYPKIGAAKTYHSDYVPNGLKYMEYFEKNSRTSIQETI